MSESGPALSTQPEVWRASKGQVSDYKVVTRRRQCDYVSGAAGVRNIFCRLRLRRKLLYLARRIKGGTALQAISQGIVFSEDCKGRPRPALEPAGCNLVNCCSTAPTAVLDVGHQHEWVSAFGWTKRAASDRALLIAENAPSAALF